MASHDDIARDEERWRAMVLKKLRGIILHRLGRRRGDSHNRHASLVSDARHTFKRKGEGSLMSQRLPMLRVGRPIAVVTGPHAEADRGHLN